MLPKAQDFCSDFFFVERLTATHVFPEPVHGGVLSISSANLFAIGITIDIAIGFIFLLFFSLGGLPPPSVKKMRKIKPMAMSMVMPMAKRIALLIDSTSQKSRKISKAFLEYSRMFLEVLEKLSQKTCLQKISLQPLRHI